METINEINRLTRINSLHKSEQNAPLMRVEDKLTLSPEAAVEEQKMARFVEMLHEMPEVKMASSGSITQVVARKIYEQHIQLSK